jgi:ABC transporter DrrB family efflux protein
MTTITAPSHPEVPALTPAMAFSDTVGIAQRNLKRMLRTPQLLFFSAVQPIMFVLLFRYVFGGSINTGGSYVNYLMPGIFVQVVLFGGAQTAVGLATDLKEGVIDRFRTLPMARSAVLAGRTLADLVRNCFVVLLMVGVGVLVGFRFHGASIWADIGALVLVLAFGYAFSWVFAAVGLAVKDPETAQVAGFLPLFPLVFASSAFVQTKNMPSGLRDFANNQPVSITVTSARDLLSGMPVHHELLSAMVWSFAIFAVFVVIAVRKYGKVSTT